MVYQDGICLALNRDINQRLRSRHATDDALYLCPPSTCKPLGA
jgi:hypothetical protein